MASTKRKKKEVDSHDGWPVSFGPLKKDAPKEESLDFLGSNSDDEEQALSANTNDAKLLPSLTTGECLPACNGSDIQLTRGASARPNLAMGRGRYLIILPGMLSFKTQTTLSSTAPKTPEDAAQQGNGENAKSESETKEAKSVLVEVTHRDESGEKEKDESSDKTEKLPPTKRKNPFVTSRITKLGTMEQIETDNPVLRIPFDDGRSLVFQGTKAETSSKFMMLNCKASKGTVACKDIFSSAIVFGEGKWECTENGSKQSEHEEAEPVPFRHYGGSDRTVDGVVSGALKKRVQKRAASKPNAKLGGSEVDDEAESDEIDDSDEDLEELPPHRATARPKRRASTQKSTPGTPTHNSKRARRAQKQESDDESSEASSASEEVVNVDSEEEEWEPAGKSASASSGPKRRNSHSRGNAQKAKGSAKKETTPEDERSEVESATKEVITVDSEEDEGAPERTNESESAATMPKRKAYTQKRTPGTPTFKSKRARRAQKQASTYDETSQASSAGEEVFDVESDEDEWAPGGSRSIAEKSGLKRRGSRSRNSTKKAIQVDLTEDDSAEESEYED